MSKPLNIEKGIDRHLHKVLDADGNPTAMDISTDSVRVKNLEVTGDTIGVTATDSTKHPLTTVGIANDNLVEIDAGDVAEDDYAQFTADGLKGLSATEVKADLSLNNVTNESKATMFTNPTFTGNLTVADGFTVDSAGSISLDSHSGNFIAKKAGTEFSQANSAYAGMILGATRIANNATGGLDVRIDLTSTMTVLQTAQGTDFSIAFVAPPSGNVFIEFRCYLYTSSTTVAFALSDNATFNEIDETHTYDSGTYKMDETDINTISIGWLVTGLTSGTSYTYYIAGEETSGSTASIFHGRNRTTGLHYPPIMVTATAMPASITTGE